MTEKKMINVALPKGRLGEIVYGMMEQAGYECPEVLDPKRKLTFENEACGVRYFWVKPSDVPIYVERGAAVFHTNFGIASRDLHSTQSSKCLVNLRFLAVHISLPVRVIVACNDHEAFAICIHAEHLRVHFRRSDQLCGTLNRTLGSYAALAIKFRRFRQNNFFAVEEFAGFVAEFRSGGLCSHSTCGICSDTIDRSSSGVSNRFCHRFCSFLFTNCRLRLESLNRGIVIHHDGFAVEVGLAHRRRNRHVGCTLTAIENDGTHVH